MAKTKPKADRTSSQILGDMACDNLAKAIDVTEGTLESLSSLRECAAVAAARTEMVQAIKYLRAAQDSSRRAFENGWDR